MPYKSIEDRRKQWERWRKNNPEKFKATQKKWQQNNKEKVNQKSREWRNKNPEKAREILKNYRKRNPEKIKLIDRENHLRSNYNIDIKKFNELLKSQNNRCAICNLIFTTDRFTSPFVDHNHTNNKVRGLLCGSCNSLLGYAKDDISILLEAIKYLNICEK